MEAWAHEEVRALSDIIVTDKLLSAVRMLAICGHANKQQIMKESNLTENEFETYRSAGIFGRARKPGWDVENERRTAAYKVPINMRREFRSVGITAFGGSDSPIHDCFNYLKYAPLSDTEKERCRTDGQEKTATRKWIDKQPLLQRSEYSYMYKNGKLSVPDFSYVSDEGELVFVEIDNDYKPPTVEAKRLLTSLRGAKWDYLKIKGIISDDN